MAYIAEFNSFLKFFEMDDAASTWLLGMYIVITVMSFIMTLDRLKNRAISRTLHNVYTIPYFWHQNVHFGFVFIP